MHILIAAMQTTMSMASPSASLPASIPVPVPVPTFSKDVAPILYKNCVTCHRPGEIGAAQSLLSYGGAKPWAAAIKAQVLMRTMPPWPADPKHSMKFRNDPSLTQHDIDTLAAWADTGALQGNAADAPPLPHQSHGWAHPRGVAPDAVLSVPEISLPASGEVPYIQQRVRVSFPTDRWIVAMQVRPGNDALVHHMGITEEASADGIGLEQLEEFAKVAAQMGIADSTLANVRPVVGDPVNPDSYDMLGVYTPGSTFEMYDAGTAKLLKAGKNIFVNFNIHYTTSGKPDKSRSELALWFRSNPPRHQLFRAPAAVGTIIANGRQLLTDDPGTKAEGTDFAIPPIPPYSDHYELIGITAYTVPTTLYQLQPHAHMRAKDFEYTVVYPDGRQATVLTVPKYDFHWQLAYQLDTPLKLPAGSKLIVTAHYDNSAKNEHLRGLTPANLAQNCGPDKEAFFRRENQSWHEMFSPLVQYSVDDAYPGHPHGIGTQSLPIAEVVGCLAMSATNDWTLKRASNPVISATASTSAAALRAAASVPFGDDNYSLLGVRPFDPQLHTSQKVAVKGVLLRSQSGTRFNVTSLQAVRGICSDNHEQKPSLSAAIR